MNIDDFNKMFENDRHALSDSIRKGNIPFDLCLEAHGRNSLPPLLLVSMLIHPDCSEIFFKINYYPITMKAGTLARQSILPRARALRYLECVKVSVGADDSTIKSIMDTYSIGYAKENFLMLIKNPFIPKELKDALYEVTGDERLLSQEAQDIFIF